MPDTIIEAFDKKRKSSYERWSEAYELENQRMKQDLENNVDPELSYSSKKIIAIVARMLNISFTDAKNFLNEWALSIGVEDLTKATKPGGKAVGSLVLSTAIKAAAAAAEASVPICGFTGSAAGAAKFAAGVGGAAGSAGDTTTSMMTSLQSSKQVALQNALEAAKRTVEDNRDSARKQEELQRKMADEERTATDLKFRTAEVVTR